MDSTTLYLDRNNLSQLGPEIFLGRSKVTALYLNSSKITGLSNGTFVGLTGLKELYLDHNELVSLDGEEFDGLSELEVVHLDNNHLQFISNLSFIKLSVLRILTLHNNMLVTLQLEISSQTQLQSVTVHDNRWQCVTACQWLQTVEKLNRRAIRELNHITCEDDRQAPQNMVTVMSSCKNLDVLPVSSQTSSSPLVVIIVSVAVVILLVMIIIVLLLIVRRSITTWIYSTPKTDNPAQYQANHLTPALDHHLHCPSTAEYSAYLHYCMADDQYVRHQIAPRLDTVGHKTRLCLHHRDLMTNTTVGQAISKAVSQSKCLIILASPSYFESSIPRYELQMILACVPVVVGYPIIVIVRGGDVVDMRCQFREQVGTQSDGWTFLDIEDVLVWDKIGRVALDSPTPQSCSTRSTGVFSSDSHVSSHSDSNMSTVITTMPNNRNTKVLVNTNFFTEDRSKHGRVMMNPIERVIHPDILDHHNSSGSESIYAAIVDGISDQEPFMTDKNYDTILKNDMHYLNQHIDAGKLRSK